MWALANGAAAHGARILPYHRCVDLRREDGAVTGARAARRAHGRGVEVEAGFIINAARRLGRRRSPHMAGIEGVAVVPGKGIMIAMNHRLVNTVVNRCTMPADGDILVPIRTVSVIGTTDIRAERPRRAAGHAGGGRRDARRRRAARARLPPGRALRVWAGVRPLFKDENGPAAVDTRDVSRGIALVDHLERDGVSGFLTITGGKLTTYRLMAEEVVDAMCGSSATSGRARRETAPPGLRGRRSTALGSRCARVSATCRGAAHLRVRADRAQHALEEGMRGARTQNLDDIRRSLRLGMGPCQGGFCIYRARPGSSTRVDRLVGAEAQRALRTSSRSAGRAS